MSDNCLPLSMPRIGVEKHTNSTQISRVQWQGTAVSFFPAQAIRLCAFLLAEPAQTKYRATMNPILFNDRHITAGKLESTKVEGKVLILKSSVDKLLEG